MNPEQYLDEGREQRVIIAAVQVHREHCGQPAGLPVQPQRGSRPAVYRLHPLLWTPLGQVL